jgi:RNA polymerase sigma-70 factor (ECF subfamily)
VDPENNRLIIENSKKGDVKSQYLLYNQYAKAMYNVCYRMMSGREEAEDMLQESFTEAFNKLYTFRFESTFGAWLKRITVNKCINEIKRKKTDLNFFDDMSYFKEHTDTDDSLPEISVDMIKKAMEELPNGSRMIFSLYLLEGYDHREIAQILDISESNSKTQYMRAKIKIKELLKGAVYEN